MKESVTKIVAIKKKDAVDKTTKRLAVEAGNGSVAPDMTLKLKVRKVAEDEGINTPYELSRLARLPYETCRALWNDQSNMIALKTLERLCTVLKVRPGQMFEFEPEVLPPRDDPQPKVKRGRPRKPESELKHKRKGQ